MNVEASIKALSALAHPGRLEVFRLLACSGADGLAAGEVARLTETPANTMSTQLAILARAGLIQSRRESRSIIYQADYGRFAELLGFLIEDCCDSRPEICSRLVGLLGPSFSSAGDLPYPIGVSA